MIYHWSSGIFQDNNRTQKIALNFLLRFIQMNEEQFQSTTIWPYIIHLYMNLFKVRSRWSRFFFRKIVRCGFFFIQLNVSEETTACLIHAIENNMKISTILSNLSGIEYYIETKIFDSKFRKTMFFFQFRDWLVLDSQISSILVILQLLRSLFILHINRQRSNVSMNDETDHDDQEMICRHLSRLTFKFITRIIQQVDRLDLQRRENSLSCFFV